MAVNDSAQSTQQGGILDSDRQQLAGLDELLAAGFVAYAGTRQQIAEGGVGAPSGWNAAVVAILRVEDAPAREAETAAARPDAPLPITSTSKEAGGAIEARIYHISLM